jgi:xanthine dehydrogenase YagS FAD-binding subunit
MSKPLSYLAVANADHALAALAKNAHAQLLAGGTNLIDEMKLGLQSPEQLVDINALPLDRIDALPGGGIRIGATVRNSDLAWDATVRRAYPVLSQAILSGASPQLRNMATTAGNVLQKTRCTYYRDTNYPCNKRSPGSGCAAIDGYNRGHAILGASSQCIATHPSDMCVALAALDAVVNTTGPKGNRSIPFADFHVPYGDDPAKENTLLPGELITSVDLPPMPWATRSVYIKVRDRASYEFALASAAVVLDIQGNTIRQARVALGGVATKPWRSAEAEAALIGKPANDDSFAAAGLAAVKEAKPRKFNAFKVELARRTLAVALANAAAVT